MQRGRPTKLTPELIADVRRFLPTCLYMDSVGDYIGVARSTWRLWLRRGRREAERLARDPKAKPDPGEAIYLEFSDAIKRGLAEAEMRAVSCILNAAPQHWQAAAWVLERRWPQHWGRDRQTLRELQRAVRELQERVSGVMHGEDSCG